MRQDRNLFLFIRLWAVLVLATAVVAFVPAAQAAPTPVSRASGPDAAGATCVVLQPNPTNGVDAYIKQEHQDERRGGDPELRVKTETGKLTHALLKFDLSSIPSNTLISSATLSLFVKGASGGPVTINAHGLTASWKESEVTWKARDKAGNLLWATLGGDFDPAVVSSAVVDDTKNVWRSWSVTSLASNWLTNPSANFGVILESPVTNPKTEKIFKSSDDGTLLQRPKLEVCYNAAVSVQPDNNGNGAAGLTRTYAHVIHVGGVTSAISAGASSSQGWATRIYKDVNGNGLKDAEDTLISATPVIGPNVDYPILVQVDVPVSAPAGIVDITTVTVTAQTGGATSSASDRTQVGRMLNLQPDRAMNATPGTVLFYGHSLTNNGETRDCTTVTATSGLGWTVLLWADLNHNGVHETDNPNEPALGNLVCLNPGEAIYLVAEIRVPAGASAGAQDQTVIKAVSGVSPARFDTATDTTTVFLDNPPAVDGKYDTNYSISPYSTEVCYNDPNGVLFGKLASYYQPTADAVYFVLAIDKDFVDNTYGTNAVGWPGGHKFGDLTGSDHAQFQGFDSDGTLVLDFKVDYLTATTSGTPSGYATLGVTGGEGRMNLGSASSILAWGTSLDYSMNSTGYCSGGNCNLFGTDLEQNSPATTAYYAPNPSYPKFIYDVIYEVKVARSAFGAVGFGSMEVPYIHASPSKLGTNTIYAEPGECPGEIGDFVWHDLDGDTVQDPGEPGIASVSLNLYRDNGDGYFDVTKDTYLATATTDATGKYLFQNLAPDDYFVDVVDSTVPAGYKTTTYNDPTSMISLNAGEQYLTADFGYGTGAPIGDYVWEDLNHDGIQGADEPGVAGATVKLLSGSGTLLTTTTTDAIGAYLFPNRPAGTYQIEFVLPPGYAFTLKGQGSNPAKDSDANPATGRTDLFTTTAVPDLNRDAGLIRSFGAIGDFVWYDADGDGIQDVGEPGIANVTLDLYRDGAKVASTVTDADGGYLFEDLVPGNYVVDVTDLNGVLTGLKHVVAFESQPDPTATITLSLGELYKYADFGYVKQPASGNATIGDTVWYDANGDKFQQPGEPGIPGIQVCATPAGGGSGVCTTTDATGRYLLEVPAGSYTVAPTNPPAGYSATTAVTQSVTVTAGQQYLDADFGYNSPNLGSIGNLVFRDANKDGVYNSGDTALGGVSVDLVRNTNGNATWDPGEPVIATVTTATALDGNTGNYLFTGVPAGNYFVHVSDTNGVLTDYTKSPLGTANTDNNNQADPYKVTLTSGSVLTADFGYYPDGGGGTGNPNGAIGNQVWVEKDGDGVFNPANGDFGQAGVTVELLRDGVSYATTVTGPSGDYLFIGLDAGNYSVQVTDDLGILGSYRVTKLGANPGQDNNNQAQPYAITLPVDAQNTTADFGYILPGAIGDYVWYDANANGIEDVGEPGIGNATVRLYRDNGDGVLNTSNDTLSGTAVTDVDGGYLFTGLLAGVYFVDVDQGSAALSGLTHTTGPQSKPDPFGPVTLAQGQIYRDADFGYIKAPGSGKGIIGDTVWYDGDGDGVRDPGEPGIPGIQVCATPAGGGALCDTTDENGMYQIEVLAGNYTIAPVNPPGGYSATTPVPLGPVTINPGDQYLDADFGYASPSLAKLSGTVWHDLGRDGLLDAGEPGIPSVSVDVIHDSNGNGKWDDGEPVIATTTTDQSGNYEFKGLPAGSYLVVVPDTQKVLDDFVTTVPGPNPGQDNNNQAQPYPVVLAVAGTNTTADFGYVQSGSLDRLGVIGNQVWFESDGNGIFNQDGGDAGVAGVTVKLYRDGVFYAATTTGAGGDYVFTSLPGGSYSVAVSDSYGVLGNLLVTALGPNPGQDNNNQAQPYAITLPGAGLNMTADFGYTRPGAIGDFVWYDADRDGIEDVGEPGIANVTLDLYKDGVKVATTVTDADGGYLFGKLLPGSYTVDVADANPALAGLTHVVDRQSQPDPTATISLVAGDVYKDADFGYAKAPGTGKGIIGDTVWYDANSDKFQQPGEPGISGIQVCATPAGGGAGICTTTDANGHYLLEVPAGGYNVAPTNPPAGYSATTPTPLPVTVPAGQQYLDADFGYNSPNLGSIGNLIFQDANKDGVYNSGDTALGGVSVDLIRDANGSKTWDAGEPVIATVTTGTTLDGNTGNYLFTGAPAGDYLVHVTDTNGVLTDFTKSPLGNVNTDNNNQADPYPITLAAGGSNLLADFGYWRMSRPDVGVIGNQIWVEKDGNGVFDPASGDFGQPGVTVELYKDGEPFGKTTTGAGGDYAFIGLPAGSYTVIVTDDVDVLTLYSNTALGPNPGQDNNNQAQPYAVTLPAGVSNLTADFGYLVSSSSIGDTVYYDDNRNGVQDTNEDGIGAVNVQLWTDNGGSCNKLLKTTSTDGNGKYIFPNLAPAHYCVVIPETLVENTSLAGLTLSGGTNPASVTLATNQNYRDADFGYAGRGIIRGVVYLDLNGDGMQGPTEPGIPNVQICLYPDADKNGVPDSTTPLACVTTDSAGVYVFPQQYAGSYALTETDPGGLTSTTSNTIATTLVVTQGAGISDYNNFGDNATPSYDLTKVLTSAKPVRPNTLVSFDIKITNTGSLITFLPLRDTYDKTYLQYVGSVPASVDNNNDGTIDWTDLTTTFGDLAYGASITVKVNFLALKDTSSLPGGVTINTAVVPGGQADPDGNGPLGSILTLPLKTASDTVQVFTPTGVGIASFKAVGQADGVLLSWTTASEQDIAGFNVLRELPEQAGTGELAPVNAELIPAQYAGTDGGGDYSMLAPGAAPGGRYVLEVFKTDGSIERYELSEPAPQ